MKNVKAIPIPMQKVKSSNISAIGYNQDRKIMDIRFKNGRTYRYFEVMFIIYKRLINPPKEVNKSVGKAFWKYINNQLPYVEITKELKP